MSKTTKPKPRRFRRAFLVLLIGLGLLVAAAPTVVMNSPLLAMMLTDAIPAQAGKLSVQHGSGGWFTPVALHGVELRDASGERLLQADEIALSHTLPSLLSQAQPLKVLVQRPTLQMVVRPGGNNLQDLLAVLQSAKAAEGSGPEGSAKPAVDLQAISIRQATVYVTDTATGARYTHQNLNADLDLTGGISALSLSGRLGTAQNEFAQPDTNANAPNFRVDLDPIQGPTRRVELKLDRAPVGAVESFARRFDPTLRLNGYASGSGTFAWQTPQPSGDWVAQLLASGLQSEGMIQVEGFALYAQSLGSDTLRLARLETPWRLKAEHAALRLEDIRLTTEVGAARAQATLTAEHLHQLAQGQLQSSTGGLPVGRIGLDLDVARLAQLAPSLLALRSDVRPLAGRLVGQVETQLHQGQRVTGNLTASGFQAEVAGRQVAWEAPFSLTGEVSPTAAGPQIHRLACESAFLNGNLQGDLSTLRGNLTFNLDKLATQLGQLVDLRMWRLAGQGDAEIRTEEISLGRRKATLIAHLTDVDVAYQGSAYLSEPQLTASVSGEITLHPGTHQIAQLDAARLAVQAGDDELVGQLTQPLAWQPGAAPQGHVALRGSLASWQNRLRVALTPLGGLPILDQLQLNGQLTLTGDARVGAGVVQLTGIDAQATNLQVQGGPLAVQEPRAELSGDFVWDRSQGLIESRAGKLVTSTISLRSEGVRAVTTPGNASASGRVAVLADLAQLNRWFLPTSRPVPSGQVNGVLQLSQQAGRLGAQIDASGKNIRFADPATQKPLLQEPNLRLVAQASYLSDVQQLVIDSATVTSDTLQVQAQGSTDAGTTQLAGTVDYDLTALAPVLAGYLGPEIQVTGRHRGNFELSRTAGPTAGHWSRQWQGRFQAPWTAINLLGLPIGPGQLAGTLQAGEAKLDPLQLAVSGGTLSTQLSARLDPPPAVWGVVPGPLLTNVQITPQISERLLKYIAPVLAGATRSQGVFSLNLQSAGGPLNPLAKLGARGQLQARQVLVTPGPTTVQWVQLAKQVEALVKNGDPTALLGGPAAEVPLLAIADRTIDFSIQDGRVEHQGLQFEIGDVSVMSGGSVGFDETLDLVLSVPVKDAWIAGRPMLSGLRGQVVQLPIRGTFKRPEVDQRALRKLSQSLVREGVRGAIGGALQRLLGE